MTTSRRHCLMTVLSLSGATVGGGVLLASTSPSVIAADNGRASPASAALPTQALSPYRELKWDALIPKGWDPSASFRGRNTTILNDTDPRARKLLKEARAIWDHAPTVGALDGARIRIPGYVVPLETSNGTLTEFLLVPYFGACIHTPPPPANQIIDVLPKTPTNAFHTMDTVWVSGTLRTTRVETSSGVGGYRIEAVTVEPYLGAPTY